MKDQRTNATLESCVRLRILATSDVHGHLRAYDYARNCPVADWGLTRVASAIEDARSEAPCSILLDNGDFLQGTPLADLSSTTDQTAQTHPILSAMKALKYDALNLGNHEFNYGLDLLTGLLADIDIPVLCANTLTLEHGDTGHGESLFPSTTLIRRILENPLNPNDFTPLSIGVIGLLPPQIMTWDGSHLLGRVTTRDMVETTAQLIPKLRDAGADIVVVLAHTGIDPDGVVPHAENAALAVAQVPGVDVLVTGHTHMVFPNPGAMPSGGIDHAAGTLYGVPTVMPGYRGSHLGVIDLYLGRDDSGWTVTHHTSEARPVTDFPEHEDTVQIVARGHHETLSYLGQPLGKSSRPIHSYLGLIRPDLATQIVGEAQRHVVETAIADTKYGHLPLLSAVAPYQTGGRAGPLAFVDIPAGALTMRSAANLYPFPNTLCAIRATGAEVRDWLERAASCFRQIEPHGGDQPLLDPSFPGHAVDTLLGLTYRIDLTQPPAYDPEGRRRAPGSAPARICEMRHKGVPVRPDDLFVVAVNAYRVFGGGPYDAINPERILLNSFANARGCLIAFLSSEGADSVVDTPCWSFLPVAGARGIFETGPGFQSHPDDMAALGLDPRGLTEEGFLQIRMPLEQGPCESGV